MDGELLPLVVGSSGVTAVVVAVITAIVNRRKLSAEATNIISQAAGGVVERLENENIRLTTANDKLTVRVADLEKRERQRDHRDHLFEEQVRMHQVYDEGLAIRLRNAGITDVPPPPPLLFGAVPPPAEP